MIHCDGGHNRYTGTEAFGSVCDGNGSDLISTYSHLFPDMNLKDVTLPSGKRTIVIAQFSDVKSQQNNGAELLALVCAFRIALHSDTYKQIGCDSELLVKWWSLGHVNKRTRSTMDKKKFQYIEECTRLRKLFESKGGSLIKIAGSTNIADLGWHR